MATLEDVDDLRTRLPGDEDDLNTVMGDAIPVPEVFRADTTILTADQTGFSADYSL